MTPSFEINAQIDFVADWWSPTMNGDLINDPDGKELTKGNFY